MEFVTSVVGGKTPGYGRALSIALGLQGGNTLAQVLHAGHPTRQTATGENTNLDLGYVEPAAMFGGVMELHALQNKVDPCVRVRVILRAKLKQTQYWLFRTSRVLNTNWQNFFVRDWLSKRTKKSLLSLITQLRTESSEEITISSQKNYSELVKPLHPFTMTVKMTVKLTDRPQQKRTNQNNAS